MRHYHGGPCTSQQKEPGISSIADLSGRAGDAAAGLRALALVPAPAPAPRRLAQAEAAFDVFEDLLESPTVLSDARARAHTLLDAGGEGDEAESAAALAFAAARSEERRVGEEG